MFTSLLSLSFSLPPLPSLIRLQKTQTFLADSCNMFHDTGQY